MAESGEVLDNVVVREGVDQVADAEDIADELGRGEIHWIEVLRKVEGLEYFHIFGCGENVFIIVESFAFDFVSNIFFFFIVFVSPPLVGDLWHNAHVDVVSPGQTSTDRPQFPISLGRSLLGDAQSAGVRVLLGDAAAIGEVAGEDGERDGTVGLEGNLQRGARIVQGDVDDAKKLKDKSMRNKMEKV